MPIYRATTMPTRCVSNKSFPIYKSSRKHRLHQRRRKAKTATTAKRARWRRRRCWCVRSSATCRTTSDVAWRHPARRRRRVASVCRREGRSGDIKDLCPLRLVVYYWRPWQRILPQQMRWHPPPQVHRRRRRSIASRSTKRTKRLS